MLWPVVVGEEILRLMFYEIGLEFVVWLLVLGGQFRKILALKYFELKGWCVQAALSADTLS